MSGRGATGRSGEANKMMSATRSKAGGGGSSATASAELRTEQTSQSSAKDTSESSSQPGSGPGTKLVFGLNPRAHRPKRPAGEQKQQAESEQSQTQQRSNGLASRETGRAVPSSSAGHIRASKYGNFYKPQDLTQTAAQSSQPGGQRQESTSGGTTMTKSTGGASSAPAGKQAGGAQQASSTARQSSVRARSKSPDRSARMARRKSFDEDISTTKTESPKQGQDSQQQQQQQQPPPPILKTRTQFNILPPPQMTIATTGKGSVVDYAKSRIYDRPVRPILANPPPLTVLDDQPGQVPASILSGKKPPKQVMVSKAREKWEGGEPFAKCKSRKRLAAQANKKLFPGTWSMTSVVATQQLHLQQALAQFNSSGSSSSPSSPFNRSSNPLNSDPSVKVLTRGSVLERIQQYEKAPGSGAASLSGSSSLESFLDEEDDRQISLALSRSSSASSALSLGSYGAGETSDSCSQAAADEASRSKEAQYKSRATSIEQQQQQQQQIDALPAAAAAKSATAQTQQQSQQQRRPSLRRRSSLGPLGRSSTQSLIPRFYHPNGKPNTYEIEVQKRNIVACFEKLPERRAQLVGSAASTARRQFHQIALACGYSEYFKVPLQLYAKHKLETSPQLASLGSRVDGSATLGQPQRKSSTVALNTNGLSGCKPAPRSRLVKAASVEGSGSKLPHEGAAEKTDDKEEPGITSVTCDQFLACWRDLIGKAFDQAAQFVHLLTFGQRNYLQPEDFVPLVQSIIDDHPGLKFLRAAPDFHMRYIQTVIARIYYNINRSWTGKLSLQELRKSNLLAVLKVLGQEEDVNQITDYFSYEHFYVIYCKFWSLDQDHDLFISKEDLARHNDAAISSRIIERIFAGIVSKQIQKTGKMSYSDFVWFLIAEEDKKHPRSIEYWFRLMDLDGDGYISMYEMEYFYYEQMKRLELMNIEALPFLDSACQILDLVNPREKNKISLADLKRTRMATIFFDTFINLEKYLEHESREFVSTRDVVQNGVVVSDWNRYASEEYENLVTEESTV